MDFILKHLPTERCCMFAENQDRIYNLRKEIGLNNLYLIKLYLYLNSNLDVSNEEFYKMIIKLFNIKYYKEYDIDYLEFLNNKDYTLKEVKTDIIINDVDMQDTLNQVYAYLAIPSNLEIKISDVIDSNELKKILSNPDICLFGNTCETINQNDINFKPESINTILPLICEKNSCEIINDFMNGRIENMDSKTFNFLVEKLKETIKNKNICACLEKEIDNQYKNMNSILLGNSVDDYFDNNELMIEYLNGYNLVKILSKK